MTPTAFIAKWRINSRNERAAAQEHFLDPCVLLDEPTPNSDPTGAASIRVGAQFHAEPDWSALVRKLSRA